jgi:hypothetical protein
MIFFFLQYRYARVEVPLHIVPSSGLGKACLESLIELPKILCQEEEEEYKKATSDPELDLITKLQNSSGELKLDLITKLQNPSGELKLDLIIKLQNSSGEQKSGLITKLQNSSGKVRPNYQTPKFLR